MKALTVGWKYIGVGVIALSTLVSGCCTTSSSNNIIPTGYTPLDPMPVVVNGGALTDAAKLDLLPNEDWRLSTAETDGNGNVTYGPATISASGTNYTVVLDYIKYVTKPFNIVLEEPSPQVKAALLIE
jgi:hypothetical protein